MMGRGRGAARALSGLALLAGVVGTGLLASGGQQPARQLLGSLSVQGAVWTQDLADGAREVVVPGAGTALLERTRIRTGTGGAALLTLGPEGVIGLRAESRAEVGARGTEGPRIELLAGEALVRLPAGSRVTLATSTATIRTESVAGAAAGAGKSNEASVRITPDGQTVVRVQSGSLRVDPKVGPASVVNAGEQATLSKDGTPRIVAAAAAATTAAPAAPAAAMAPTAGGAGILGSDAAIAALAGVAVVAGTLGGLGASGEFGGGGDGDNGEVGQGSPFKPHPPHPPRPPGPPPGHGPGS